MMIHFSGNLKNIGVKKLTENLDLFLSTVSDEPNISGAMPLNCEKVIHCTSESKWQGGVDIFYPAVVACFD